MSAPVSDAALALEVEAAWAAYEEAKQKSDYAERERKKWMRFYYRQIPYVHAFEAISRFAYQSKQGVPHDVALKLITEEIVTARRKADEIERRQKK